MQFRRIIVNYTVSNCKINDSDDDFLSSHQDTIVNITSNSPSQDFTHLEDDKTMIYIIIT